MKLYKEPQKISTIFVYLSFWCKFQVSHFAYKYLNMLPRDEDLKKKLDLGM